MDQVAVIIPFYKTELTENEKLSLKQCFKILSNYPVIAIKPHALNLSSLENEFDFLRIESFDNHFFENINGYNRLMLSDIFYGFFLNYEYILIYQLDAFVFSDQLKSWCEKNYDYIGAPWLYPRKNSLSDFLSKVKGTIFRKMNTQTNGVPKKKQFYNQVGNGGFSLRKTKPFYELSIRFRQLANTYIDKRKGEFNEDIFWSIEINRKTAYLRIPDYKIALKFAVETEAELAFKLNHNRLPFGCHAWEKNPDFWLPVFQQIGIEL